MALNGSETVVLGAYNKQLALEREIAGRDAVKARKELEEIKALLVEGDEAAREKVNFLLAEERTRLEVAQAKADAIIADAAACAERTAEEAEEQGQGTGRKDNRQSTMPTIEELEKNINTTLENVKKRYVFKTILYFSPC